MNRPPKRKGNRANKNSYVPNDLETKSFFECTPTQKLALSRIKEMKLNRQRFVEIENYFADHITKTENNESVTLNAKLINLLCYGLGQGRSNVRKNIGNFYQRSGLYNVTPREHKGMVFNKVQPGTNLGRHPKNGRVRAIPSLNKNTKAFSKRVASTNKKKKKQKLKIKIPSKKINLSKNSIIATFKNGNKKHSDTKSNGNEKKANNGNKIEEINKKINRISSNNNLLHEQINEILMEKNHFNDNNEENEKEKEKEKKNKKKQTRIFEGSDKNYNSNCYKPEDQVIDNPPNNTKRLKMKINSTFGSRKRKSPTNSVNYPKINIIQDQILYEKNKVLNFKRKKRVNPYKKKIDTLSYIQKQHKNKENSYINQEPESEEEGMETENEKGIEIEIEKEKEEKEKGKIIEIEIEKTKGEILETETDTQTTKEKNKMETQPNPLNENDPNSWIRNPFQTNINQIIFSKQVDNNKKDIYGLLILLDFLAKIDNKEYYKTLGEIESQAKQANNKKLLKYIKQKRKINN
ncbi:hypothetical protein M0812_13020 [Anaeramoeba flamelloides]|uniref:Uncharacterized protein n=1 Tax=Anaeramoeba flamelloides TaxID=1746091 RepID=A0AAV7ZKQ1_9EUKA|nr:hypothetical protein M0812_13020 [Anaeramoeba flamelloides]